MVEVERALLEDTCGSAAVRRRDVATVYMTAPILTEAVQLSRPRFSDVSTLFICAKTMQ